MPLGSGGPQNGRLQFASPEDLELPGENPVGVDQTELRQGTEPQVAKRQDLKGQVRHQTR